MSNLPPPPPDDDLPPDLDDKVTVWWKDDPPLALICGCGMDIASTTGPPTIFTVPV